MNDKMKLARYSTYRFEIVDESVPLPLRDSFNTLTTPLRMRIKELEKLINEKGLDYVITTK
jgi:hypothetical protein